jgi:hypothetical protein
MPYVGVAVPLGPLLLNDKKIPTNASATNAAIAIATNTRVVRFAAEKTCGLTLADVAEVLIEVGLVLDTLVDVSCVVEDDVIDDDESPNFSTLPPICHRFPM